MSQENVYQGMGNEMAKAIHGSKDFTTQAILTLVGYWLGFFVVGFIMNLIFLSQANKSKQISGISPSGRGFLLFLLWSHLFLFLIFLLFFGGLVSIFL